MTEPDLSWLGWSPFFGQAFVQAGSGGLPARVIGEEKDRYRLQLDRERILWGELPGRFRYLAQSRLDYPATGDWLLCEPLPGGDRAVVRSVLPRRTCLVRRAPGNEGAPQVLASNVDVALIATSLNSEFNPRRLERYLAVVADGGARPAMLLTKSDLVKDPAPFLEQVRRTAPGTPAVLVSSVTGDGLEELGSLLPPAKTAVFLGSSGVGKSTLINHLLGEEALPTGEIRPWDDRGRHTTSGRYLFVLPSGAIVIDTPGLRELQLLDQEAGLETAFADVEDLFRRCRFSDCRHDTEPGCAVSAALADGTLDPKRWQGYRKLEREVAFQRRRGNPEAARQEKERWKRISKAQRDRMRKKRPGQGGR